MSYLKWVLKGQSHDWDFWLSQVKTSFSSQYKNHLTMSIFLFCWDILISYQSFGFHKNIRMLFSQKCIFEFSPFANITGKNWSKFSWTLLQNLCHFREDLFIQELATHCSCNTGELAVNKGKETKLPRQSLTKHSNCLIHSHNS